MKIKQKKCKICETLFTPLNSLHSTCNYNCALLLAQEKRKDKDQKEWNKRKQVLKKELMTLQDWLKIAQTHFNHYIRLRDKGNDCISCGKKIAEDEIVHASHYKPAGTCYATRFNENNVFISCVKCNTYLSGSLIEYRKRLINKIGLEKVEEIELLSAQTKKFTIQEVQEISEIYKKKVKELKK